MRHLRSLKTAALAALNLYLASSLFGRDCPPETFDYGPSLPDEEIVEIVLEHYGPTGPLVPSPEDYTRASRDVSLIRKFIPYLESAIHQPDVPPGYFWVLVNDPNDAELGCLNIYYASTMHYWSDIPPFFLWRVVFPQSVNLSPMMAIYVDLPAVESAFPDAYGCPAAGCCLNQWAYAPLNGGIWRWQVHSGTPFGPGGSGCYNLDWVFTVSDEGVVGQSPDLNGDSVVDVNDLLAVINAWGACPGPTGGHCPPDLDSNGLVDVDDLLTVINNWG